MTVYYEEDLHFTGIIIYSFRHHRLFATLHFSYSSEESAGSSGNTWKYQG
jgi:hypothetical protein